MDGTGFVAVPPPLPPPPQLVKIIKNASVSKAISAARFRRRAGMQARQALKRKIAPPGSHPAPRRAPEAGCRSCPSRVVLMVREVEPEFATEVGLKLQLVSAGRPEQEKLLTVPLNPFSADTLIVACCDCPCATVTVPVPVFSEKSEM